MTDRPLQFRALLAVLMLLGSVGAAQANLHTDTGVIPAEELDVAGLAFEQPVEALVFLDEPQIAAMLAGDVDAFPRFTPRGVPQFKADPRFQVIIGGSRAKTILAFNNKKKPLDDVRVRRAISMADS